LRIVERTPQRLRLRGIPGGAIWMTFALCLGLAVMAMTSTFAWASITVSKSYWPLLPLALGFILGMVFTSIGFLTLAFGRVSLTLDRVTGLGHYQVRSPVIEVGKPCQFELSQILSVTLQRSIGESAVEDTEHAGSDLPQTNSVRPTRKPAQFCKAILRITPRRRKIMLDETQNSREQRVANVAQTVADWLQMPLEEVNSNN